MTCCLTQVSLETGFAVIFTDRVRTTTEGYVFTGVCLLTGERGVPQEGNVSTHVYSSVCPRGGGGGQGGTPRYLPLTKVPTPQPDSNRRKGVPPCTYPPARSEGEGYPKVPTPHQGTYPPGPMGGRGYPKVPTPLARSGRGEGYLKVPTPPPPRPRIEQHMEYLIHRDRYVSCVHAGGLSCLRWPQQ